ncbi:MULTISPECIES: sugar ABC transporter ATP-binding protein [unclassified Oceanispirochaeta]|uniref:sugar ABC transporter ATP-binding protein n=1 Tax=unclassified Oceanispirochaeta TaxID=2635722 RepID=UPI000E094B45|nr:MULTISPECIES: ATP-binding cassette domain-containing protein [unclassified Oceanispirochaeta]MBF9018913.1 ATP-binding cassette domain-containing protein [Oceanispirochaeta sp. M2]NPD75412.1 ATP-binding cassette domain-containing protein [Oceanispirochaeta sp. M1]RDG28736.1 ATP-binding cassette domain-containing protein [Oceanispirochaeta sp. M1]
MQEEYLLRIKDVSKSFSGVKVLKKVCLNIRAGSVHSLMGENGAGKSTLMKCLFGIYRQDEGEFFLEGTQFNFEDPKHALEHGVSMVHQELNQVVQRTIIDNIWLGRYPKKHLFVDEKKMYDDTKALFRRLDIHLDPRTKLDKLSVSQRQMVEIAKAVSYNAKVIVLDEPTSSLTDNEVKMLFDIITVLKTEGVGIVYISHKMEEIFEISDEVTVLRDGNYIGTDSIEELTMEKIVNMMVGRDLEERFPPKTNVPGEVHMSVKNLTTRYRPVIKDVNFDLRRGEILGVAGLVGAGRTEMLEALFGARTLESGEIYIDGLKIDNSTPHKAINNHFALLTEERRETGIYPVADITFNSTISNVQAYKNKFGFLVDQKMKDDTDKQIGNMRIKTPNRKELIRSLSGGNQQKVIIGRWLLTNPDVLLLDEPTRGIDVGAKFEIYQLIIDLANSGKSVIVVSSEMPELLGVTNRIMVMSNGLVSGIVNTDETTQTEIFNLSAKYLNNNREAEV